MKALDWVFKAFISACIGVAWFLGGAAVVFAMALLIFVMLVFCFIDAELEKAEDRFGGKLDDDDAL